MFSFCAALSYILHPPGRPSNPRPSKHRRTNNRPVCRLARKAPWISQSPAERKESYKALRPKRGVPTPRGVQFRTSCGFSLEGQIDQVYHRSRGFAARFRGDRVSPGCQIHTAVEHGSTHGQPGPAVASSVSDMPRPVATVFFAVQRGPASAGGLFPNSRIRKKIFRISQSPAVGLQSWVHLFISAITATPKSPGRPELRAVFRPAEKPSHSHQADRQVSEIIS